MPDYQVTIELDVFDQPTPLQAALDTWLKTREWPQMTVSGQVFDLEPLVGVWNGIRLAREVHEHGLVQVEVEAVHELRPDGHVAPVEVEGGEHTMISLYLRLGEDDYQCKLAMHFQDFTGTTAYEDALDVANALAEGLRVPVVLKPSLKLAGLITD